MTPNEFKAWLDGFSAAIIDAPTKEQWEIIKKKVENIREESSWKSAEPQHKKMYDNYWWINAPTS